MNQEDNKIIDNEYIKGDKEIKKKRDKAYSKKYRENVKNGDRKRTTTTRRTKP